MKKLIALLLSLSLLAGAVPAAFAAEPETPEEQPVFRMGIMGDHQLNSTTGANMEATISAMHYFADHGVDAVIDVGDIADGASPSTIYPYFLQKYGEIIGEASIDIAKGGWVSHENIFSVPRDYESEMI